MIRLMIFTVLCFVSAIGQAQLIDTSMLADIGVRNIGPAGMSGRVTCIDVVRDQPERIFIGTASGGVWKSENGGVSWEPIFDDQPTLSIGAIAIDPSNADVIWVGTGEGNPRNSHNSGRGLFKSIDGGRTWSCKGLEATKNIHRLIIDPRQSNVVYVGAIGRAWGDSDQRGVFKTSDGGSSWEKVLYVNDSTGVGDMVMDPSNPDKILVAMWEHRRRPWTFHSGGKGSGLHLTYDGGKTWKELTSKNGLPKGDLGRIGLSFAPSNPEIVYALIEAKENGFYKSQDGGHTWKRIATKEIGNRPFYYADIFVDPLNELRIFNLWSYVSLSEDGGRTFRTIMDYGNGVHPDHHALYIHPDNPKYIINGNDGGLNISHDGGKTWRFAANIPVGQFYHISVDTQFPYRIYGGLQDNGSWVGPNAVLRRGGIRNYDWQEIYFGDGFDVAPILGDDRYGYAMSQGGNVARYDLNTGKTTAIKPVHEEGKDLRFNWNAAIASDPFSSDGLYFGSQYVHHSPDRGKSWKIISPDLTTNDTTKQEQGKSGGLTIDATQAENYTTILCITPSSKDSSIIWVGTDDGQLQITNDGGSSWTAVQERLPDFVSGSWIPQIRQGQAEREWFVIVNDYRRDNWAAYTYRTMDGGKTFNRIVSDNDVDGFVCSFVQDHEDPSLMFLGTDVGLYYSNNNGKSWSRWGKKMPHVQIRDMHIHPRTSDLVIGTFGRSIFVIDDISFMRSSGINYQKDSFHIINTVPGHLVTMKSYKGIRFTAQGEFIGDNSSYAYAVINYYGGVAKADTTKELKNKLKKSKKGKNKKASEAEAKKEVDKSEKKDKNRKIHITVFDDSGDTLRYFTRKKKNGFQRLYWDLRRNGVRYPSNREVKKDSDPPRGLSVAPGRYQAEIRYLESVDTIWLNVRQDPRRLLDAELIKEKEELVINFYDQVSDITQLYNDLGHAKENIIQLKGSWKMLADSTQKELNKRVKPVLSKLDSIRNLIVQPKGQKGIQDRSQYLTAEIYSASSIVSGEDSGYGSNVQSAIKRLESKSEPILRAGQSWFEKEWATFKQDYHKMALPIFSPELDKYEKE